MFSTVALYLYLCTVESLTGCGISGGDGVFFLRHLNDRPSEVDLPIILGSVLGVVTR